MPFAGGLPILDFASHSPCAAVTMPSSRFSNRNSKDESGCTSQSASHIKPAKRVEAERGSRRLMLLKKAVDILGQFRTNPLRGGDLLYGRFAEPIDGTESAQKQILAVLTHSRAIV